MAGVSNYPTALDDNTSLFEVADNVTPLAAAHHNNLKAAMIAVETRLGILGGVSPTAIDVRLGHPTLGHTHSGASGQGPEIISEPNFEEIGLDTYRMKAGFDTIAEEAEISSLRLQSTSIMLTSGGRVELNANDNSDFLSGYKHYLNGGWGVLPPRIATSSIHATYSQSGQIYYDSANNKLKLWTGATWRSFAFE